MPGGGPGGPGERVVVPVVDHAVMLGGQSLGGGVDVDGPPGAVPGPLRAHHHTRQRAVGLQAVVVEAQGLADPAGGHVHLAGQGAVVHHGRRVLVGAVAAGEGDVEEVVAGGAVLVHVAAGEHGYLVDRAEQSVGAGPLGGRGELDVGIGPGPPSRPPLAGAPRDPHGGLSRGDGGGEMGDRGARTAAAVADLAEEGEVAEADGLGQLHLVGLLHRVGGERVDLARGDPGVVQRGEHRATGQGALVLGKLPGERGLSDPDDRGGVLDSGHTPAPPVC